MKPVPILSAPDLIGEPIEAFSELWDQMNQGQVEDFVLQKQVQLA